MPTLKELAGQELAQRYSLAGRTQMMPMRPEPSDRGYFGAKGLVEDYAGGLRDAGVSTLNYLSDTDISQMASDAARLGQGMVQGIAEDPLMAAAEMVPGVGLAMGAYEAEKLRDQALQAEQSGQFDLADSLRAQASSIMAMSAIPGGRTARRGARMDMAGKADQGKSILTLEGFGPVEQTMRAGEVIRPSMYDVINEKGYSVAPFMANVDPSAPRPDNISAGTFKRRVNEYENNPIVRQREQARLLGGEIVSPQDAFMQTATLEQLQNRPLVMLPADRLAVGQVNKVAGVDVRPFRIDGGPQYADINKQWLSMQSAARAKQGHINRVRDETKTDPVAVYVAMGEEGSDFSVGPSIATARYLEATDGLTPEGVKILDQKMKSLPDSSETKGIASSWPGYKSPDQLEEYLTVDKGEGPSLGNRRKAFMSVMDNAELLREGMPNRSDIYASVNNPELRGMPVGASGLRALITEYVDPNEMTYDPLTNASYDTVINAQQALALPVESMTSWDTMFPSMAKARADKRADRAYRSSQTAGGALDYQMADQEWLDNVMANPLGGVRR